MLDWLLDTVPYVARWKCGDWPAWHGTAYIIANLTIAFSYFLIPLALGWLWYKKRSLLPKPWMLLLFCGFILTCSITHVCDAMAFYWPAYRVFAVFLVICASISLPTALLLPIVVSHVMKLPSPEEYRIALERRDLEKAARIAFQTQLINRNDKLRAECDAMREQISHLEGHVEIADQVQQLRENLHRIRGV